ncbi:hypothetical protein OROMI_014464 [Orobanche minor]
MVEALHKECLQRLSISLGGNTIVPVASEQFQAYFSAPEWQKHHTTLIALAQIAEGCSEHPDQHGVEYLPFFRNLQTHTRSSYNNKEEDDEKEIKDMGKSVIYVIQTVYSDEKVNNNINFTPTDKFTDKFGSSIMQVIALGGIIFVPVASKQSKAYFSAPEWQKHHTALIGLAQIAEGCSKLMVKNLEQVVNMVLSSFQHCHPHVKWAEINAIGQLSTGLGPDLQIQFHQHALPALAADMDDFQNPRVQVWTRILFLHADGILLLLQILLKSIGIGEHGVEYLITFQHPDQHGVEYLPFFRNLQTHTRSSYNNKEEDDEKAIKDVEEVIALGGIIFVPVASKQSQAYFSAPEWQKHHTALIGLAQIAEGCSKLMVKNLEQVVNMVLSSFQHCHPHVKWAEINAIGQLSTGLGPDLQIQFHQHALPALAADMDDFQNPRVQAHAASAVCNFSENCTPEILTPYLDGIVHKLLLLLQVK